MFFILIFFTSSQKEHQYYLMGMHSPNPFLYPTPTQGPDLSAGISPSTPRSRETPKCQGQIPHLTWTPTVCNTQDKLCFSVRCSNPGGSPWSCIAHSCSTSTLQAEHLMGRNEGQPGGSDLSQGGPEFRYTPRNDIQPGKMGVTAMGYESPSKEDSRRCEVWAKLHNLSGLLHNCHFLCHYSWLMLEGWHRACIQLHVTGEGALAGQGVPRNVWLVHSQITFAIHKRPAANLLHNYQHTAITFSDFLLVGEKEEA